MAMSLFGEAKVSEEDIAIAIAPKPSSLYVAVTGIYPVSTNFSLFGKVGVALD